MYSQPARLRRKPFIVLSCLVASAVGTAEHSIATIARASAGQESTAQAAQLKFIRQFSSAADATKEQHPVFDRSLDIIAGPADPHAARDKLVAPTSVATDSRHHVFVAERDSAVVHVFDFEESKYSVLNDRPPRLRSPTGIAVDREDNVYVTDSALRAVLVYDSKGKVLRYLGKGEGDETYFEVPLSIAIDRATGHIYVCDSRRHMIIMLDRKAHILGHFGRRWGGKKPGEFRYPSKIAIAGDEIIVLESGNSRLQVLDLAGHFRRELKLAEVSADDGLAVDDERNIYVSNVQINVINVLDRDGQFLYKFGRSGIQTGEFNEPSGMWIDSQDRLYVADTNNHRVQLFQIEKQR